MELSITKFIELIFALFVCDKNIVYKNDTEKDNKMEYDYFRKINTSKNFHVFHHFSSLIQNP